MNVEVVTPEEYMGDVIGDLNSRRGKIQTMDKRGKAQVIKATGSSFRDVRLCYRSKFQDTGKSNIYHAVCAL